MSIPESVLKHMASRVQQELGQNEQWLAVDTVNGGDINSSFCLRGRHDCYFLKLNAAHFQPMFACEFRALKVLAESNTLCCPRPFFYGQVGNYSYLLMEYLTFVRSSCETELGHKLAKLHRTTETKYGWQEDNFIGTTPQKNSWHTSWCEFWVQCRLLPQWELAEIQGYGNALASRKKTLFSRCEWLLKNHHPEASLLHGDLWSGNKACYMNSAGTAEAVIFDPASYYGDRETDIALTQLFGGFSQDFYHAYEESWPLAEDYALRCTVYQLYHMLNHLNLFGSGYLASCQNMIDKITRSA